MFLPISDAPNPQRTPWVTYALIAANVAVYVLVNVPLQRMGVSQYDPRLLEYVRMLRDALPPGADLRQALSSITAYDLFVFEHGFRPSAPQYVDLLTSMFLHGGLMHLFGNMLFLWIYGDNVEYRLGWWKYLLAYLFTGVAATLAFAVLAPGSKLPLVGASGAISGVLGFYFLWFPRNVVRMFVFLVPILVNVIEIPARIVLGFYLVADNLLPLLINWSPAGGGVAHGAHIGGFVAGLALAWVGNQFMTAAPPPPEYRGAQRDRFARDADTVSGAIARGDMAAAARAYFAAPGGASAAPPELLRLADWLVSAGHAAAALNVYLQHTRQQPAGPGAAEAHVGAGLVLLGAGQTASAYQYLRRALELNPSPETVDRARAGLEAIASNQKYPMRRFSA